MSVLVAVLMSAVVGPIAAAPIAATATLSADEAAGLIFMREEEKLAHDVHVTLYQQYGLTIFNNITNSEATHMASIKTLLDRYELIDPAAGNGLASNLPVALSLLSRKGIRGDPFDGLVVLQ